MRPDTIDRLQRLNAHFYEVAGPAFSATRNRPWPGWARLLGHWRPGGRTLDIGCGNGRFARYLAENGGAGPYLGWEPSASLLADAKASAPPGARFEAGSFPPPAPLGAFDHVVAFGVLHHVPGRNLRRRFIEAMAAHAAPGGLVVLTVWHVAPGQSSGHPKARPWSEAARVPGVAGLDETDLETGDLLLGFGPSHALRYCHRPPASELDEWLATPGLRLIDRYFTDGPEDRANEYLVWRRSSGDGKTEST